MTSETRMNPTPNTAPAPPPVGADSTASSFSSKSEAVQPKYRNHAEEIAAVVAEFKEQGQ